MSDAGVVGAFREVMAGVCTPVSVVTAMDGPRPHGTTVSAFASLSMAPPMVLVSLDRGSELLAVVRTTRRFGVNILASHTVLDARTVPADPLTYHSRAFGTHTPLPAW